MLLMLYTLRITRMQDLVDSVAAAMLSQPVGIVHTVVLSLTVFIH